MEVSGRDKDDTSVGICDLSPKCLLERSPVDQRHSRRLPVLPSHLSLSNTLYVLRSVGVLD